MKKLFTLLFAFALAAGAQATSFTVQVGAGGRLVYAPNNLDVHQGDTVIFTGGFSFHPTVQISKADYVASNAGGRVIGFAFISGTRQLYIANQVDTIYYICESHGGSGMKGKINVLPMVGVSKKLPLVSNLATPNPATTSLHFNFAQATSVEITNQLGQVILKGSVPAGGSLPIAHLPQGTYYVQAGNRRQRFVKE